MTTTPGDDAPLPSAPAIIPEGGESSRRDGRRAHLLVLLLVLLVAIGAGIGSRGVADPLSADAREDLFSAERAERAVSEVVAEPRPVGSPENDRARAQLATQLDALGFTSEVQEGLGVREIEGSATAAYTRNLVAARPGTDPTGTIVLATHIDSVPGAPGAADAGVGLAVILETVRALGPEAQRNDLVVLLVDGEEHGLLGAEDFLASGAEGLREPVVVLNHEARGVSGRPLVTRTSGPMHAVIGSAPSPELESFTDALFAIIPHDTDFTVYREGGWWGMDMAIIDDSWAYHSPQDDVEHLDRGTLQHFGELTLALTRDLGDRDLGALADRSEERPIQTTAPGAVLQVPPLLVTVLGLLAPLAVLVAVLWRRRRGELSLPGVLLGAVTYLAVLAVAVLGAVQLWQLSAAATPQMLSQATREPVRAELFLLAELLWAAAVAAAGWVLARALISRTAILCGASFAVTLLLSMLAVVAPALGGWMILPAAIAAAGVMLASVLPPQAGLVVRMLALLPTGWMLGTQLSALAEFGIASANGGLAGTALIGLGAAGALALGATEKAGPPRRHPRRLVVPALVAASALGASVGGAAFSLASGEPTQEQVVAQVDGASGDTRWEVTGGTAWGRELDGARGDSAVELPAVELADEGDDRVQAAITAPRSGSALEISAAGALTDVTVDGVPLESADGLDHVQIHGVRAGQVILVEADIATDGADVEEITVVETSYDPSLADGWIAPGDEVSLVQPRMEVTVTATL